jgi:hypothetical protein
MVGHGKGRRRDVGTATGCAVLSSSKPSHLLSWDLADDCAGAVGPVGSGGRPGRSRESSAPIRYAVMRSPGTPRLLWPSGATDVRQGFRLRPAAPERIRP